MIGTAGKTARMSKIAPYNNNSPQTRASAC